MRKRRVTVALLLAAHLILAAPRARTDDSLASPDELRLQGLERAEQVSSALGPLTLRWARASEAYFGKSPKRASLEAASAVSRSLRQSGFGSALGLVDIPWKIVFLNGDLSSAQIPPFLKQSCHPGWMTPPTNIYLVAERLAGGCGSAYQAPKRTADAQLTRVLVHEIAHAVEYALAPKAPGDRARAEGFASWFEAYAARNTSSLSSEDIHQEQRMLARSVFTSGGPSRFDGSPQSYALASTYFHVLYRDRSVKGILDFYRLIEEKKLSLHAGVVALTGWSDKVLERKILDYVGAE